MLSRRYLAIALSVILTAGIVLIDGNISNAFRRYIQPRRIVYHNSCRCEHRMTLSIMVSLKHYSLLMCHLSSPICPPSWYYQDSRAKLLFFYEWMMSKSPSFVFISGMVHLSIMTYLSHHHRWWMRRVL